MTATARVVDGVASGLREIAIDVLCPDPRQPRKAFDPVKLEALAASIRVHGVLEPLLVAAQSRTDGKAGYTIVAGERRWRAAKLAGLAMVPALVQEGDAAVLTEIQLVENLQREDLTALEMANGYAAYLTATKKSQAQLAQLVGVTEGHVSHLLSLLRLPPSAKKLLAKGVLSAAAGRELARLNDRPELIDRLIDGPLKWHLDQDRVPGVRDLKDRVDQVIRAESEREKAAAQRTREAQSKRATAGAKTRVDAKWTAQRAADVKAAAARTALDAAVKAVIAGPQRARLVASIGRVRAQLRIPPLVAEYLAGLANCDSGAHVGGKRIKGTDYEAHILDAVWNRLPGKWGKTWERYNPGSSARDAQAALSIVALDLWLALYSAGVDEELEAAAKKHLATVATKPPAAPARKGKGK